MVTMQSSEPRTKTQNRGHSRGKASGDIANIPSLSSISENMPVIRCWNPCSPSCAFTCVDGECSLTMPFSRPVVKKCWRPVQESISPSMIFELVLTGNWKSQSLAQHTSLIVVSCYPALQALFGDMSSSIWVSCIDTCLDILNLFRCNVPRKSDKNSLDSMVKTLPSPKFFPRSRIELL